MIPKIIWQTHKFDLNNMPEPFVKCSSTWINKNIEWEYKYIKNSELPKFVKYNFGNDWYNLFISCPLEIMKVDIWKYMCLYTYGGLYVDADIKPLVPLHKFIENDDDLVTCISSNFKTSCLQLQLNPHFILSNKNNVILQNCIDRYIQKYINKDSYNYWKWSICNLFIIKGIKEKKSQIIYINNTKFKFLYEKDFNHCEYNGEVVLNNRYDNYKNHNFID